MTPYQPIDKAKVAPLSDVERLAIERCAKIADRSAELAGRDEVIEAFGEGGSQIAVLHAEGIARAIRALVPSEAPVVGLAEMRAALEWYADKVSGCRKIGSEGDAPRQALDADGGKRAVAALSALETDVSVRLFEQSGMRWMGVMLPPGERLGKHRLAPVYPAKDVSDAQIQSLHMALEKRGVAPEQYRIEALICFASSVEGEVIAATYDDVSAVASVVPSPTDPRDQTLEAFRARCDRSRATLAGDAA